MTIFAGILIGVLIGGLPGYWAYCEALHQRDRVVSLVEDLRNREAALKAHVLDKFPADTIQIVIHPRRVGCPDGVSLN